MYLLEANNITKNYTGHLALDNVSMHAAQGQVHGLLGPNGAGKTTLIRIINHITAPDSGEVLLDGHRLTAADVSRIGYLPEERGLYKKMKVGEQAVFFARLKGMSRNDARVAVNEWFERLDISSWYDKKVEELSKGMAQKVQFVITVLHRPTLLIFDEPFSGFDPINADILRREILRLRDQGATVIFSTHNMSSVEEICDDITLINRSRVILDGEVNAIRREYGGGRLYIDYDGDGDALQRVIDTINGVHLESNGQGIEAARDNGADARAIVTGVDTDDLRAAVIAAVNPAVSIRALGTYMPSMDDIFISAVKASQKPTNI